MPNYWKHYGWKNFLWLSDIGLFLTLIGIWLESPLIISMVVVGILFVEILWNIDFFFQLITKRTLLGIASYMFDSRKTKFMRALSLFHVFLPVIWFGCLIAWGYESKAFYYQLVLIWIIFIATYLVTDPQKNINWIFTPRVRHWQWLRDEAWLIFMLIAYPILTMVPIHFLLIYLVGTR